MLTKHTLIGFVPTANLDTARHFYADVLGLELVKDDGFALVFRAGANMLRVVRAGEFTPQPFTILGWEVENVDTAVSHLRERDVQFLRFLDDQDEQGVWTAPNGDQVAWFSDPDGNTLSLSRHR